jgi:hypothetical protein
MCTQLYLYSYVNSCTKFRITVYLGIGSQEQKDPPRVTYDCAQNYCEIIHVAPITSNTCNWGCAQFRAHTCVHMY